MKFKKIFSFPTLIFLLVWGLLFVAGQSKLLRDPGTFSHTAIGAYILDSGRFIQQDVFSFTRFGHPWIAQQWLGECVMSLIQRLAGFDGLLVLTVSLIALLFMHLASRIERSGMNLALGALILMLSLAASSHHFHIRPHIATMIFMVMVYGLLADVEAGNKNIKSLFWLIPVFILWSNIHGGALGGLLTVLLAAVGWTLAGFLGKKQPLAEKKDYIVLWLLTLLCFLSPLINPYGYKLPLTWLNIMRSSAVAQLIQEHASVFSLLHRGDASAYVTVGVLVCLWSFYIALLAGVGIKKQRVVWYLPLVWFFLSLSRVRHAPIFAVMVVVAIAQMFPSCRWVRKWGEKGLVSFQVKKISLDEHKKTFLKYLIPVFLMGFAFWFFHNSAQWPSTSQRWVRLDATHWPTDILEELKTIEKNNPRGTPIFNDMLFGGFLIYHTPGLRVFMDDRCELYGDDLIIKYVKAQQSDFNEWEKIYRFNYALLKSDSNYRKYLEGNPNWRVLKRSRAAIIYQRNSLPSQR